MAVSPQQVLTDPRFQALTPEQKRAVLLRIDPNFARLSPSQQEMVVLRGSATKVTASGKEIPPDVKSSDIIKARGGGPHPTTNFLDVPFSERIGGRIKQNLNLPEQIRGASEAISGGLRRTLHPNTPEARNYHGLQEIGKALGQYSDPANVAGDVLTGYFTGADFQPGEVVKAVGRIPEDILARRAATPGSRIGAISRAKGILNTLESRYKTQPVDFAKPLEIAKEGEQLARQGYNLPKPMADFIDWIKKNSKAKPIPGRPGEFIDQPASDPLLFENARNFIKALNDSVNWEDFGGRKGTMGRLATQMIESLTDSIKQVMHPRDAQFYEQAMRDYSIGKGMQNLWGTLGKFGGRVATYGSGVPHAWAFGHVGSRIGEGLAGSLAKSVSEFESPRVPVRGPEPETEMISRGATEANPALKQAVTLSNTIEQLERMRHRQYQEFLNYDPKVPESQPPSGDFMITTAQISKLKEQLAKVRAANPAQFPTEYKNAPQTVGKQGGGGANYSAEDLEALKKRLGITPAKTSEPYFPSALDPQGKNEPAAAIPGGGVVENVFGEKTIHPSLLDWVKSHGFEVREKGGGGWEVAIPWSNRELGTSGVQWFPFKNMFEAREALGYGNPSGKRGKFE